MVLLSRAFIRKRVLSLAIAVSVTTTSFALAQDPTSPRTALPKESSFLSENAGAMKKMMADMTIKPSGDIDRDFVEMMVPHHQGAVDMAKAELEYGHNKKLLGIARKIVAMQRRQIKEMRDAIADDGSPEGAFAHDAMRKSQ
jgi:uncharacterized protein (DUF305 family)